MRELRRRIGSAVSDLSRASAPLTGVGLLMALLLVPAAIGLVFDARTITGAPAWLKPAKFAASTAIYSLTLAWLVAWLPSWRRTTAWVGWTTAIVFVLEIAIIYVQAWRGTTSHFNVATPVDGLLFAIMGVGIATQTVASGFVAVAVWRERLADAAMAAALRAGTIITILGAATGSLMTAPTAAQLQEARATGQLRVAGAHTVGAPDGGPGLPGTGWSTQHGDVRVPHFVGLHALQVLPAIALLASRRVRPSSAAVATVRTAAASYAALFGILLVQALRGESIVAPGPATVTLLIAWVALTTAGLFRAARPVGAVNHGQPAALSR